MDLAQLVGDLNRYAFQLFEQAGGEDWAADLRLGAVAALVLVVFGVWLFSAAWGKR